MVKHNAIVDILDDGRRAPDTPEALSWGLHLIFKIMRSAPRFLLGSS